MADDNDLERTEQPSQQRLDKAREEGQTVHSQEWITFAMLLAGGAALWFFSADALTGLKTLLRKALTFDGSVAVYAESVIPALNRPALDALWTCLPLFAVLIAVAVAAPMVLHGWVFTLKPVMPDFTKLSPLAGVKRVVSVHGAMEFVKALIKVGIVGFAAALLLLHFAEPLVNLSRLPLESGLAAAARMSGLALLILAATLVIVAGVDVPVQFWQHYSQLKMTREELRQEAKESEGDPHVKAAIRNQQRSAARKRMMAAVPKADVIVTNPTHYAVAIGYEDGKMRAPRVLAKGADVIAAKIREIAAEHRVPVLEAPALARALYTHVPLDAEVPEKLYTAVAEVLAWVYRLRLFRQGAAAAPAVFMAPDIPSELDPLSAGSTA